ncbi:MAG: 50S ribosomal protein L10 [Candidatus Diapherotrites archaeon]|uniref:Large ribosomal subunit protein uL10 n=1 Tax=Candidatus Iainarchaeum sp. TaxID=3101447 RepID=A0A2D6LPR6_9ARCH|nr:50S ribosomal protein L10 [Candidatus Diapherotrites archaeon]|tara:strand:+ start:1136 stop:2122 length:987 start_codon:yes stop_codon:yes gene_type:complete
MTSHTKPWKEKQLTELKQLASSYPVVAVADVNMYPAALFQQVRKKLKKNSVVKVSKTKIIKKALSEVKETNVLVDEAKENCALIFTEMNPFELYAFLKKNKGKIAAKTGAIAEEDISIAAGDTGIPPGPALSDLKSAGLKVAVQGPTISIMEDKVVTKAGEPVSEAVAGTLSKLNIKPFKVDLKIISVLEQGQVYKADVLDIDTDQVFGDFVNAHKKAFNLAVNAAILTSETTELLVTKAFNDAKAVALEANILTSATVGSLLAKANAQASVLKPLIKDAPKEEPKEEAKEESKEETSEPEAKETPKEEPAEKKADEKPAEEKKEDNS